MVCRLLGGRVILVDCRRFVYFRDVLKAVAGAAVSRRAARPHVDSANVSAAGVQEAASGT